MQVELLKDMIEKDGKMVVTDKEHYGIKLISENDYEYSLLTRFNKGGIKINGMSHCDMHLTFRDMIGKED